ncbi:GAF domain-containing protein [Elusimicrobiota bacterium]
MINPQYYHVLCNVLLDINLLTKESEIGNYMLEKISDVLNTEAASIFVIRDEGRIFPIAAFGVPLRILEEQRFSVGKGIVGWVAQNAKSAIVKDPPKEDQRFDPSYDQITGFTTKSIVAAPILFGTKIKGVIEFLNKKNATFDEGDEQFLTLIGRAVGSAFEKAKLHTALEQSEILKQATIECLTAGLITVDPTMIVMLYNQRAEDILRSSGCSIKAGMAIEDYRSVCPGMVDAIKSVLISRKPLNRQEAFLESGGMKKHIGYSCVPVIRKDDSLLGATFFFQDITDLKK